MAINLRHLRVFAAVVDHGGFTKAAGALRLTQPAISKSIHELEKQLGLRLLDRAGKTLVLTVAGRALHSRARELFGVEKLVERELRELRGLKRGALRIAATPTIANYLLPAALGRFRLRHPGVPIRLSTGPTREIARSLLESRVDLALVERRVSSQRLESRVVAADRLAIVAAPSDTLAGGPPVDPALLEAHAFVVGSPRSANRALTIRALAGFGIRMRNALHVGGTEAIKRSVAAGLGIAVLPRIVAADHLAAGRLVEISVRGMELRHEFVELRVQDRQPSAVASELLELFDVSTLEVEHGGETASDASGIA